MSDNHSSANILPKSLSILIETLVAHNEISSWNIYQNQDNATCVTIRFSGLSHDKHMSPANKKATINRDSYQQLIPRTVSFSKTIRFSLETTLKVDRHVENLW